MSIQQTISNVKNLVNDFSSRDDISIYQLLKNSGYFKDYSQITVGDIKSELIANPPLVESWLAFSENKRGGSGWYFKKENKNYIVGNLETNSVNTFSDSFEGCAEYIRNEIEQIRNY